MAKRGQAVRKSPTRSKVPTKPKGAPADADLKKEIATLRRELAEAAARHDHHCLYRDEPPEVACARLLCPRRNICLVSLMEQHFLIPPAARWCNSVEGRGEVHS